MVYLKETGGWWKGLIARIVSFLKDSLLIGRVVLCHQRHTHTGVGNCRDRETITFTVALDCTPEGPGAQTEVGNANTGIVFISQHGLCQGAGAQVPVKAGLWNGLDYGSRF